MMVLVEIQAAVAVAQMLAVGQKDQGNQAQIQMMMELTKMKA
tara:strand:+ start:146 stop:271 length:126 start_codon:yes stop_codon:yes gene_type:complete